MVSCLICSSRLLLQQPTLSPPWSKGTRSSGSMDMEEKSMEKSEKEWCSPWFEHQWISMNLIESEEWCFPDLLKPKFALWMMYDFARQICQSHEHPTRHGKCRVSCAGYLPHRGGVTTSHIQWCLQCQFFGCPTSGKTNGKTMGKQCSFNFRNARLFLLLPRSGWRMLKRTPAQSSNFGGKVKATVSMGFPYPTQSNSSVKILALRRPLCSDLWQITKPLGLRGVGSWPFLTSQPTSWGMTEYVIV